jgi:ribosomal protein S18 acetylase RimI-like enzyme
MPAESIRIVEATSPDEIRAAGDLLRGYARSLGWDDSSGWIADEIARLPGPYAPPHGSLLLAFAAEEPAGVVGLQRVPDGARIAGTGADTAGELKRLFVRPDYRGRGIGRMLMRRAELVARARGYDALVLTTSAEMMPLAQALYDSLGYIATEPYRNDMPWPQIRWMRLPLGHATSVRD